MDKLYILREKTNAENRFNAGSKAREDVDSILIDMGAHPMVCEFDFTDNRSNSNKIRKLLYHHKTMSAWSAQLKTIPDNSTVVVQFPVRAHTVFLGSVISGLKKRGIKTIAVIHDLDALRNSIFYGKNSHGFRLKMEEISALKNFDIVVAHNEKMKAALADSFNVGKNAIISLEIFDYLIDEGSIEKRALLKNEENSVIIAGNLDCEKCGYAYKLPTRPTFELYGSNYKGDYAQNVHYNGAFLPNELPENLRGAYGLIWDGDQTDKCTGIFGEYLKINNPHKTSLYLACGIPVIVWSQSAIADFVLSNNCGIAVDSLNGLSEILESISLAKYDEMKNNAEMIGKRLRMGYYTKKAISAGEEHIKGNNAL